MSAIFFFFALFGINTAIRLGWDQSEHDDRLPPSPLVQGTAKPPSNQKAQPLAPRGASQAPHLRILVQGLPPPRPTPLGGHLTCGFDSGPPAAGPAGSAEAQVSCGTGPSLTGPGQVGLKGSPHSQGVPWKVPEVSFGCLAAYLVSTEGRGSRDVMASPTDPTKRKWRLSEFLNGTRMGVEEKTMRGGPSAVELPLL